MNKQLQKALALGSGVALIGGGALASLHNTVAQTTNPTLSAPILSTPFMQFGQNNNSDPNITGTIQIDESTLAGKTSSEIQQYLTSKATLTLAQAKSIAEHTVKGSSANIRLKVEQGYLIYESYFGNKEVEIDAGNGKVLAVETVPTQQNSNEPFIIGTIKIDTSILNGMNDSQIQDYLKSKATISLAQAKTIADHSVSGSSANIKLAVEEGYLIYEARSGNKEVEIDAGNGVVLAVEIESSGTPTPTPIPQPQNHEVPIVGTIPIDQTAVNNMPESQVQAYLASKAKLSLSQAKIIADHAVAGSSANIMLKVENGYLIYEATLGDKEVEIDAGNGAILALEIESNGIPQPQYYEVPIVGTIPIDQTAVDNMPESQVQAYLASKAKLSLSQAKIIADHAVAGSSANIMLKVENGYLIYEATLGDKEVEIDAGNGAILAIEIESVNNPTNDESPITGTISINKSMLIGKSSAERDSYLQSKATLSLAQAKLIADHAVAGSSANIKLKVEDGYLVYEATFGGKEVEIDAGNGSVLAVETETRNEGDGWRLGTMDNDNDSNRNGKGDDGDHDSDDKKNSDNRNVDQNKYNNQYQDENQNQNQTNQTQDENENLVQNSSQDENENQDQNQKFGGISTWFMRLFNQNNQNNDNSNYNDSNYNADNYNADNYNNSNYHTDNYNNQTTNTDESAEQNQYSD